MKKMSNVFLFLAVILSNVMCAVVGYNYASMQCGIKHFGYSAPAWVSFLYVIPYGIGVIVCLIVALVLKKRAIRHLEESSNIE